MWARFKCFFSRPFVKYFLSNNISIGLTLVIFTFFAALFETVSIGLLFPLLSELVGHSDFKMPVFGQFIEIVPLEYFFGSEVIRVLTIYVTVVALSSITRIFHLYYLNYVSFKIGAKLSRDLFVSVLRSRTEVTRSLTSSDTVVDLMPRVNSIVFGVILPTYTALTNFLIIFVLLFFLSKLLSSLFFLLVACLGVTFLLSWVFTRSKLKQNGIVVSQSLTGAASTAVEVLKNKRFVDLSGNHDFFLREFTSMDSRGKQASAQNQFLIGMPRFLLEIFVSLVVSGYLLYCIYQGISLLGILAELAVAFVVFQRVFPMAQSIFRSITLIASNSAIMDDAFKLFRLDQIAYVGDRSSPIPFKKCIELVDVSFKYVGGKNLFSCARLVIRKGDSVLITGRSGSGKTTIVDVLMRLLDPVNGCVYVDGQCLTSDSVGGWQSLIAYVEQDFYVANRSTFENILVGRTPLESEKDKIIDLCRMLNLHGPISNLPGGYDCKLGEGGTKLSGGQRQRLMIVRALFQKPEILIFDEATSALDTKNKKLVFDLIKTELPKVTLIGISHDAHDSCYFDRVIDTEDFLIATENSMLDHAASI